MSQLRLDSSKHAQLLTECTQWGDTSLTTGTFTSCVHEGLTTQYVLKNAKLTLSHCTFKDCGEKVDGGVAKVSDTSVTVNSCTFLGCQGAYGGVMRLDSGSNVMQITQTRVNYCWGTGNGGFVNVNYGYVTMTSCEVYNTYSNTKGGVVCMWYGTSGCVQSFENCMFDNCTSAIEGGVAYAASSCSSDIKVTKCRFVECRGSSGGGIYFASEQTLYVDTVLFKNCAGDGTAIYFSASNLKYDLKNICLRNSGDVGVALVNAVYTETGGCEAVDLIWTASWKFTSDRMPFPKYRVSVILSQLFPSLIL